MGKVDYIVILDPKVERITADNPREAEEKIREKCLAVKNIILNGQYYYATHLYKFEYYESITISS